MVKTLFLCKSEVFYSAFHAIVEKFEKNLSKFPTDKIAEFGKTKERFRQTDWKDMKSMKHFLSSFDSFYDEKIPRLINDDLHHSLRELILDDFPVEEDGVKNFDDLIEFIEKYQIRLERCQFIKDTAGKM